MNSEPRLTGFFHSTFASANTALLRYEPCCFGWVCLGSFVGVGCLLVGFVVWCVALMLGSYLLSVSIQFNQGDLRHSASTRAKKIWCACLHLLAHVS